VDAVEHAQKGAALNRLIWLVVAAILLMLGYEMLARELLGWTGYVVAGTGIGIATSVAGSFFHDLLAAPRERL
jgi:hypothetical protein